MAAAKRVLRYLCSTSGLGLVLGGRRPVVLTGHADASWADDQATQRSSQSYTFSLRSGSVSWRSTRSSSVLGSSCEAEIYAGAMAAQELGWLTYLLTDLGEPPRSPSVLYVDNKAMLALCREHRLEHRTKHIALRYFLARELQQRGQLRLAYVASEANTTDIFTKALPPGDHQRFCTMLDSVLRVTLQKKRQIIDPDLKIDRSTVSVEGKDIRASHDSRSSSSSLVAAVAAGATRLGRAAWLARAARVRRCAYLGRAATAAIGRAATVALGRALGLLSLPWSPLPASSPRHGLPVLVTGLPRSLPPLPPGPAPTCVPCVEGWQRAAPHSSEFPPTEAPLQTLHLDVWGPARVRGQGHERYFLLVVDDYPRYTTVFPLRRKGEVTERRIGMVMDVARTSMIHAAAPHFLWPFAVQYAAHQINLQPRVSVPETTPTLWWTGKVGDASAFRVWGSRAFVRDLSADKLSSSAVPCVFLGFPPDAPGWQFYHPTSRRVLSSQDVTFDESVPYYRLFPYRTAPLPPPPLFLAPGPPPVDPLPPQGPAPSGVSRVDAIELVEVAVDSGAARGAESAGAGSGGAEPECAEPGGAEFGGAESGGAEPGVAESGGAEPEGAEPARVESGAGGATGAGGPAAAGAAGGFGVTGPGGACTGGTGAAGPGGAAGAGAAGGTGAGSTAGLGATGGAGLGAAGAAGASVGPASAGAGGAGAGGAAGGAPGGAGVGATRAAGGAGGAGGAPGVGADARGAGAVPAGSGGAARPRPYFVPLHEQVLGLPPTTGPAPSLECPQPVQSESQLQPASPLPGPSPYTGPTGGLTERREPESRPASPVRAARTGRRGLREHPPPVPGTHQMASRPSTAPQRVPRPSPPESSLPALADPESDSLCAASPTVTRLLAPVVTDPSASTLVAELVDFAAHCRLDYAASLVAESASVCPPSVGGECALSTDVLEDRQEEFQCFAAALPHLVSMLLAPEGDPDAPDIPTPRSYAEAIEGP
ncbi:unnamed protein product [Closterium sp. NIES-54]